MGAVEVAGGHIVVPAAVVVGKGDAAGEGGALRAAVRDPAFDVLLREDGVLRPLPGEGLVGGAQAAVQHGDDDAAAVIPRLPQVLEPRELRAGDLLLFLLRRQGKGGQAQAQRRR